jgi:hypothetical protein
MLILGSGANYSNEEYRLNGFQVFLSTQVKLKEKNLSQGSGKVNNVTNELIPVLKSKAIMLL